MRKYTKRLNTKKATAVDAIPPKIVKAAASVISRHIASKANEMQVCEKINTFYVRIAKNNGIENDTPVIHDKHPALKKSKKMPMCQILIFHLYICNSHR